MIDFLKEYLDRLKDDPQIFLLASLLLAGQVGLTLLIRALPYDGPWKSTASFSAHQILVVGLMIYQTYWGFVYWNATTNAQPADLVVEETDFEGGKFLSRIVLGSSLAVIPIEVFDEHTDMLMLIHHAAMYLIASISLGLTSPDKSPVLARYAPFFFGVIELSSIPLALVDIFHPYKHPEWNAYAKTKPWIMRANEVNRIVFAVSYFVMRMTYFPKVIFGHVVPDCWNKLRQPDNEPYRVQLWTILVFSLLFTLLQLYWGSLIGKQVMKMLSEDDKKEEDANNQSEAKVKRV